MINTIVAIANGIKAKSNAHDCSYSSGTTGDAQYQIHATGSNCDTTAEEGTIEGGLKTYFDAHGGAVCDVHCVSCEPIAETAERDTDSSRSNKLTAAPIRAIFLLLHRALTSVVLFAMPLFNSPTIVVRVARTTLHDSIALNLPAHVQRNASSNGQEYRFDRKSVFISDSLLYPEWFQLTFVVTICSNPIFVIERYFH